MRKVLILTSVSAAAILIAVGSASAGGDRHVRGAGSGTVTTSAGNNSGPVMRDHRGGSSQGGSQTGGWGNATVRDHRSGSGGSHTSGWGDGAKVRDHRKPIVTLKGPF